MDVQIRKAMNTDWKEVQRLNVEVFEDNKAYDVYIDLDNPYSSEGETYYRSICDGVSAITFIAFDTSGSAIGYITGSEKKWGYRTLSTIELQNMGVSPAYQSKGIGSLLIDALKQEVKKRGYKALYVAAYWQNARGRLFYERNGFTPIGIEMEMLL